MHVSVAIGACIKHITVLLLYYCDSGILQSALVLFVGKSAVSIFAEKYALITSAKVFSR